LAFTVFFRDQQVLERVVAGRSHPRIWDAGVATGQEPYTLAMILAGRMGYFAFNNLRIDAADVESTGQFAQMIEARLYPNDELSRLPEGILQKYFEPNGKPGHFRAIDSIRRRVAYRRHDLLCFREIGRGYSLVLCKNVLLHFQPQGGSKCSECFTAPWHREACSPAS
jgi:chemotaxis protein methyltransferase CheR